MDLEKVAAIGEEIHNRAKSLSPDNAGEVERLKELAAALFAALDSDNE